LNKTVEFPKKKHSKLRLASQSFVNKKTLKIKTCRGKFC